MEPLEVYSPDVYYPDYPTQPEHDPTCLVNLQYKTLPGYHGSAWPRKTDVMMASQKKLYTGTPNYYPNQKIAKPCDTMYGKDLSLRGPYNRRETYHFKAYPLTDRYVREFREYADEILPYPTIQRWIHYPVVTEGSWGK